ncbi:MAG: efflux RND transporter periplasmic adaptor subunit [Spirochaetia bacterium]
MNTRMLPARHYRLLAAVALFSLAACSPGDSDRSNGAEEETQRIAVEVEEVERNGIEETIYLTGEIEPRRTIDVVPDQAGEVAELNVEVGDRVRRDDVIAIVDPSSPGQRFAPGPVRSPISGTVTAVLAREGSNVSQQAPMARIASTDDLEIQASVPERRIGSLSIGQRATVGLDAFPEETFRAEVVRIAPQLDTESRSLPTTLRFSAADNRIRPGMFARIDLLVEQRPDAITVPQRSVVRRADGNYIFVVNEQEEADRREVELGVESSGRIEIREGIEPGESIVTRGQNLVQNGAALRVVDFGLELNN